MNARLTWFGLFLAVAAIVAVVLPASAEEPAQPEPTYGIRAGETMPFFVADFCHGEHKDHCGCPGVIISNHRGRGVIVLARTVDDNVLALAKALEEKKIVDGKRVLAFVIKTGEADTLLADRCAKSGLNSTTVGAARDQSFQRLAQHGLEKDVEIAVLFLELKAVKASHFLKADELTAERRAELIAGAETWAR